MGAFKNWLDLRGIDNKPSYGGHIGSIAKTKGVGSGLLPQFFHSDRFVNVFSL